MPAHPNARSPWDNRRTGTSTDATRRTEIEERIKACKPLRKADVAYLREELHVTMLMRNGKDLLA